MPKAVERFVCSDCGADSPKWLGRCPACGGWNSLASAPPEAPARPGGGPAPRGGRLLPLAEAAEDVERRIPVGLDGLDRVLGGGLVPGALLLLAGEPGIGKSTLLLQAAAALAAPDAPAVYVSGEESARQVALRARRLGIDSPDLLLLAETACGAILGQLEGRRPGVVVVDSVQTLAVEGESGAAGSVGQVRQVAARFQHLAKTREVPVVLVGHVTKDGAIAGPKLLEHLVDVVLSLEGDPGSDLRVLRAVKNRFGTAAELALYAMGERGMEAVRNASAWLLEDRQAGAPGSAVAVAVEGSAPLLAEVQALVVPSSLGTPRRTVHGFDPSRLALLLAVLERRARIPFGERDVFVNLAGGLSLREPALDLAVAAALVSAAVEHPLPADLVVFGEVGLLGEVRAVSRAPERVREAAALGFARAALPARNLARELELPATPIERVDQLVGLIEAPRGVSSTQSRKDAETQ